MPFDGANFPPAVPPRKRASRSENALTVLILVMALMLLILPVSAAGLQDVADYLLGR